MFLWLLAQYLQKLGLIQKVLNPNSPPHSSPIEKVPDVYPAPFVTSGNGSQKHGLPAPFDHIHK
jgi:hypothetical protein